MTDWERIKEFLETPWLGNLLTIGQVLWALVVTAIGAVAGFRKRNVLKKMYEGFKEWMHGLPKKIYARLGLVTVIELSRTHLQLRQLLLREEQRLEALEKELQGLKAAQKKPSAAPASLPPVAPPLGWTGPRTIERFGVKFDLVDPIDKYLGKFNPPDVPDNVIKTLIHGPFCRNCNYSLAKKEFTGGMMQDLAMGKCQACYLVWRSEKLPAHELLRRVYNALDAEFRSNKKIAESDVKEDILRSIIDPPPKKPW